MPSKYNVQGASKAPPLNQREMFCMVNSAFLSSGDPGEGSSDGLPVPQMDDPPDGVKNWLPNESPHAMAPDAAPRLPPPTSPQTLRSGLPLNGACGATNDATNVVDQINSAEARIHLTPGESSRQPHRWRQHLAALLAALSAVSVGYVDAWTANALPFLQASPSDASARINISFTSTTRLPHSSLKNSIHTGNNSDMFPSSYVASLVLPSAAAITDRTSFLSTDSTDNVVHGISAEQASWLSSLVPIGAMFGSIPAGILADKLGRKVILLYMVLPCLISWIIILFGSHSLVWLFLSRGIQGVVMGIVLVVVPLYNEEISEVEVRGAIGVYQNMMVTVGILLCYIVGAFVPYRWTAIIPCAVPIAMLFSFIWMPESPAYLQSKNRCTEAFKAIQWLRGKKLGDHNADVGVGRNCSHEQVQSYDLEMTELAPQPQAQDQAQARTQAHRREVQRASPQGCWRWLAVPHLLRHAFNALTHRPTAFPLAVVFALMSFRQLTGIHAVVFYTVEIFSGARSSLPHAYEAIVIGAVEVAATCAASRLVDRVGRRPLLLASGAGTAACHAGLALYFYCLGAGVQLARYSWLPLVLLSLFIVLHACGFGPLPWFMMAELTPADHKNWATGMTGFLNWGSMFLVLKLFPTMTEALGDCFTFAVFAFNCAVACCFVYFFVPETKGKTLEQIQEEIATPR